MGQTRMKQRGGLMYKYVNIYCSHSPPPWCPAPHSSVCCKLRPHLGSGRSLALSGEVPGASGELHSADVMSVIYGGPQAREEGRQGMLGGNQESQSTRFVTFTSLFVCTKQKRSEDSQDARGRECARCSEGPRPVNSAPTPHRGSRLQEKQKGRKLSSST